MLHSMKGCTVMKKKLKGLLSILLLLLLTAGNSANADVFFEVTKPGDWYSRDLLTVTVAEFPYNDAILLECGGKIMLVDGGVKKYWERMSKYLAKNNKTHLDYIFNSHPHDDHLEAEYWLLYKNAITADLFISPFAETYGNELQIKTVKLLKKLEIPYHQMLPGETLNLGNTLLTLYRYEEIKDPNANSGVLHVRFGNSTMLLTADMTGMAQHWFLENYTPDQLKVDILKAPHHGITIMVPEFIQTVSPEMCFITSRTTTNPMIKNQLDHYNILSLFHSIGTIIMETDGKDWYVTQEEGIF